MTSSNILARSVNQQRELCVPLLSVSPKWRGNKGTLPYVTTTMLLKNNFTCENRNKSNDPQKAWEQSKYGENQIQARVFCTEPMIHDWLRMWGHCWGAGGGSGGHLGEGAVVTTTVETDLGEAVAMCCWSCWAGTVWIRTWRKTEGQLELMVMF